MALGLETALSSTSCELSSSSASATTTTTTTTTSESGEDVATSNDKSTTRKSFSHTSLADFRSLPLLKDRLGGILEKKLHCDVEFHVGPTKEVVTAHKIILASASQIFDHLFFSDDDSDANNNNNRERNDEIVSPHKKSHHQFIIHELDYSSAAFQNFIKALYTNECPAVNLGLCLALEIFYISKKYKVTFLEEQILSQIVQMVSIQNVFEALKLSTGSIELTKMVPICWKIIEEETGKVLQTHLEHLDSLNLTRILTRDHLNIEEVELFQFLVKWGSIQCKRRGVKTTGKNKRQLIDHLLKYIRFSTIHPIDFNDIVIPSRILEPKEICAVQSSHHHHHHQHHHNHHIFPSNNNNNHSQGDSSKVTTSLPYNSRPRFKPNHHVKPATMVTVTTLRRPESLTNNSIESAPSDPSRQKPALSTTTSEIHLGKHKGRKLRPKKSSRKLNLSKQAFNVPRSCR